MYGDKRSFGLAPRNTGMLFSHPRLSSPEQVQLHPLFGTTEYALLAFIAVFATAGTIAPGPGCQSSVPVEHGAHTTGAVASNQKSPHLR